MAVVVEQTIPFPASTLDLHNSQRWSSLFPLIRPTVKAVQNANGFHILIDSALLKSKTVLIAAVGRSGAFSSKVLDDQDVVAIAIEHDGVEVTAQDVQQLLQAESEVKSQGIVVARVGRQRKVEQHSDGLVEVHTGSELELDHVLHLLGSATETCRGSIQDVTNLLQVFGERTSVTHTKFHVDKAEGNPAVLQAEGVAGFEKAKHVVERDLKHVMKAHAAQDGDVTYSVHFSDVNGLSRLENYIIAGEVAHYLESQSTPYRLSHSTVLNHSDAARGFSISICPVPSRYLVAQPKPQQHAATPVADESGTQQRSSGSKSRITFDDADVRRRIQAGCDAVIKAEPTITDYDEKVGDGDCGYTLRDGAKQVLSFIAGKDLTQLPSIVSQLVSELEVNMGGTSGALYCIYLTALASALASEQTVSAALKAALEQLMKYTRARLGDRTMMDALIPYIETLKSTGDVKEAVQRAEQGVEGTKTMEASLGRSAYLDESATQGVPDPGAYGLLILMQGMSGV
ncbi:hypothetical protein LTR10_002934 [Elasticomyces elasticus]|nr:hypothetical protein LTR10_002934 [Elasticomyces elasticus]KAK4967727.1 hypothetical protein LTR42_010054 [Elasticomyces elasticus]